MILKFIGWTFIVAIIAIIGFSISLDSDNAITGNTILSLDECVDSDNGKYYGVKGSAQDTEVFIFDDYCETTDLLVEYYCNNGFVDRINIPCDCSDGKCN